MIDEATGLDFSTPDVSEEQPVGDSYTVKIDGEEHAVTLDELQNGYQRQADYTRKTQELAAERENMAQGEAIVQALESDPRGAVMALADAFGVSVGNQNTDQEELVEDLDPEEVRLRRLESSIEEHNRTLRQQNMQKEVEGLRQKFSSDIDERALYSHALKHNIGNLEAAYAHMTYGDLQDKAKNADIVDEKRAANVVESTVGSPEGTVSKNVATAVNSIRDAFALAKEEVSN
jgi:hypothetical protein